MCIELAGTATKKWNEVNDSIQVKITTSSATFSSIQTYTEVWWCAAVVAAGFHTICSYASTIISSFKFRRNILAYSLLMRAYDASCVFHRHNAMCVRVYICICISLEASHMNIIEGVVWLNMSRRWWLAPVIFTNNCVWVTCVRVSSRVHALRARNILTRQTEEKRTVVYRDTKTANMHIWISNRLDGAFPLF